MPDPILVVKAICVPHAVLVVIAAGSRSRRRSCIEAQPDVEAAAIVTIEVPVTAIEMIVPTAPEILPRDISSSSLISSLTATISG